MANIVNQIINYGRYSLELLVGVFVLCIGLKKSRNFWVKLGIITGSAVVLFVGLAFLSLPFTADNEQYRNVISYVFFIGLSIPFIVLACIGYNTSWSNKIYVILGAILTRNIARTLYNIVLFIAGHWIMSNPNIWMYGDRSLVTLPVYYLGFAGILFLISITTRRVFQHDKFKTLPWRVLIFLPIAVLLNIFIAIIENGAMFANPTMYFFSCIVDAIATSALLFSVALMTYMSLQDLERAEDIEQFNVRIKQYESISESIELINHKCHDLRHQIRAAKRNGEIDANFIDDVVKSIDIYDRRVDTGNKELDMLLMDFNFRANSQNIKTTIVADGSAVSFLERQDLISLFSNMLENALNHVKLIENEEERYVSLKIYKKDGFVFVDCENPFSPELDDAPKDKRYHGFGIPSMKRIAKKYDGAITMSSKDGLFSLTVTFIS